MSNIPESYLYSGIADAWPRASNTENPRVRGVRWREVIELIYQAKSHAVRYDTDDAIDNFGLLYRVAMARYLEGAR